MSFLSLAFSGNKYFKINSAQYPVWGIDTSVHTGLVDWKKFKDAGGTFAIIKMLDGTSLDPWFEKNYTEAKREGVFVSSYQWMYSNRISNVDLQASKYARLLKDFPMDFYPSIDYEWYGKVNPTEDDLTKYMTAFEKYSDVKLMIYSAPGFLEDGPYSLSSKFSEYPLWIAHYGVTFPDVTDPFYNWLFWQVSDNGDGISLGSSKYGEKEIDVNYYNGTLSEFNNMVSGFSNINIPEEVIEENKATGNPTGNQYAVSVDVLNVRPQPNTSQPKIAQVKFGEILEEIEKSLDGKWVKIITQNQIVGWCYLSYLNQIQLPDEEQSDPRLSEGTVEVLTSEELFLGKALYKKYRMKTHHGDVIYHVIKIKREDAEIFITPKPSGVSYVHSFLKKYGLQIAINGDGFASVKKGSRWELMMAGQSSSKGQPYGTMNTEGAIYIDKYGFASFDRPSGKNLWNAIAFPNKLVESGAKAKIVRKDVDPRTALGFSKEGDVILLAVDGKETYSLNRTGATFDELAQILIDNGAWIGVNLDGGGSTTLVVEDVDKSQRILNVPCGENAIQVSGKTYKLRPVANHFGVYVK